ncbi:50S ribosomal protein L11 methyltransferase [Thermodesulfobacteriota bacterium]
MSGPTAYTDLYIYYLEGRPRPENQIFNEKFIGNWQEDNFSFLFFSEPSAAEVEKLLLLQPQLMLLDEFHFTYEEWHGGKFAPFNVGRFLIAPPWEEIEVHNDEWLLFIDPGVVFGTGMHPTTHDCLEALELAFYRGGFETVLDLGTGSGLLAIAAARLGCSRVLAVDLNFLAAKTAMKNVRFNGMADRVGVVQGKAEDFINGPADLVIANIHYDIMKHLINSENLFNKKKFIFSGLLRSEARKITDRLSRYPVKIVKAWVHDGIWHTFFGELLPIVHPEMRILV